MSEQRIPAFVEKITFETNGERPIAFVAHLALRIVATPRELESLSKYVDREGGATVTLAYDDLAAYLPPSVAHDAITSTIDQVIERQRAASVVDHQQALVSQGVLYDLLTIRARSQQLGEQQARKTARKTPGGVD